MSFISLPDFMKKNDPLAVPLKGRVVDNIDPKKLGRVKIHIPGIMTDPDFTKLPWVYPKNAVGSGGTPDGSAMEVPTIDAELTVEFPYKEIYFGFYTGYLRSTTTRQGLFFEDYPNSYGKRDTQNTFFKVNRAKKYAEFRHTSHTRFLIEKEGETKLQTKSQLDLTAEDGKTRVFMDMVQGIVHIETKNEHRVTADIQTFTINKVNETIGTVNKKVTGSETKIVIGNNKNSVGGSRSDSVAGNSNHATAGNSTKLVGFKTAETYGQDKKETVVLGNHEVEVLVGNIIMKTLSGSLEFKNLVASLMMSVGGEVTIKSTLNTNIKAGIDFLVNAGPNAKINAGALAHIKAAMTKLNGGSSPVLTEETDPLIDLITGAPTIGVPTVLAGL